MHNYPYLKPEFVSDRPHVVEPKYSKFVLNFLDTNQMCRLLDHFDLRVAPVFSNW
jgi:hypothetical protein